MLSSIQILVPQADDVVDLAMRDGAIVRLRRHGTRGAVRFAISHGNGLAINTYAPFWLPLIEKFEIIVFDIRNHGENPLHQPALHSWDSFTEDFEQIFHGIQQHFGMAPTIGVFHSLSAIVALNQTMTYGPRWDALALFDPPIFPREGHPLQPIGLAFTKQMARLASIRRKMYDAPDILAAQLQRQRSFHRWTPGAHLLLARSTLRQTDEGSWILCNPPHLEANIYLTNTDPTIWPRMADLSVPTIIIGADPQCLDATPSAHACLAIHQELGIEYVSIPNTTHFLQIEEPTACGAALVDFLNRHHLLSHTSHK